MLEDQIRSEVERLGSLPQKEGPKEKRKVPGIIENYREPLMNRIIGAVFANDFKTVATSIVSEVIIPKTKDILADIFIGGIQKAIYGDSSGPTTYYSGYSSGPGRKASYDGYYKNGYHPPVETSAPVKVHWDRIVFPDRESAVRLLSYLKDDLRRYQGGVSVLEMYDYVTEIDEELGAQINSEFPDNNWGWTNLDKVQIVSVPRGYWVKFPRPERIN